MRTNEARARLIHRRTAEIKQERRIKRQRRLDAACVTVLLYRLRRRGERQKQEDAEDGEL